MIPPWGQRDRLFAPVVQLRLSAQINGLGSKRYSEDRSVIASVEQQFHVICYSQGIAPTYGTGF